MHHSDPRYTLCYVILSVTKDLKACTAVHRHADLEILHSVQNDSVYSVIVSALCHAEQREASPRWLHTINAGCLLSTSRGFFVTLRMTTQAIITNYSLLILKILLPIAVLVSQGLEALGRAPQSLRLSHNVAILRYRRAHLLPADKAWGGGHNLLGSPLAEW